MSADGRHRAGQLPQRGRPTQASLLSALYSLLQGQEVVAGGWAGCQQQQGGAGSDQRQQTMFAAVKRHKLIFGLTGGLSGGQSRLAECAQVV